MKKMKSKIGLKKGKYASSSVKISKEDQVKFKKLVKGHDRILKAIAKL